MPELPEVETIKNQLVERIKGKTIKEVKIIDYDKRFQGNSKEILSKILDIKRRAKLIIFNLANGNSFLIHLKLVGQLFYFPKTAEVPKFAKVVFTFSDGSQVFFNDFRKFGFVKVMKTAEVENHLNNENYGPEPLEMSFKEFKERLVKKPKAKIKQLLMDQTFIAGLGNIYAQEACFVAGVLPIRIVSSLSEEEVKKIFSSTQSVLKLAVKKQGTTFDGTYLNVEGKAGSFDKFLQVYHQEKCKKCYSKLKTIKLGGRSTYYCGKCQR